MSRVDGRTAAQLRNIKFTRNWLSNAEGSVLVEFGETRVLCVATFTPGVPKWLTGKGKGWVTSEYAMLPRATHTRSDRESVKGKLGGRTQEISRLVGRSLRATFHPNPDDLLTRRCVAERTPPAARRRSDLWGTSTARRPCRACPRPR